MAVEKTRLRFIAAADAQELVSAIQNLPFKVELKAILPDKKGWVAFFVLPEVESIDFVSIDLRTV